MPRRPSASGFSLSIDDDFDETKSHRVRLDDLEETQSRVDGAKDGEMALIWKLNLYRDDGTAYEDPRTGQVFEVWEWSSDSMFKTAKGRGFVHAFLGKECTDDEVDVLIDAGFREGLVGKTAVGSFEIRTDQNGNERLKLLLLRPDRAATRRAAQPAPEPEPEPVAARPRQRRIDD